MQEMQEWSSFLPLFDNGRETRNGGIDKGLDADDILTHGCCICRHGCRSWAGVGEAIQWREKEKKNVVMNDF